VLNDKRLGGSASTSYWYIDYKYFVDVVQYRLYLMHEQLKDSEQLEIERQTFQCKNSDCGREYTALEVQRLLMPGQYQFHCGHCNEPLVEVSLRASRFVVRLETHTLCLLRPVRQQRPPGEDSAAAAEGNEVVPASRTQRLC
jgi:transcription initiation factor IIE alpha subunit